MTESDDQVFFSQRLSAVSLFSGAGGFDVGFNKAGYRIEWANDLDETACETYSENHQISATAGDLNKRLGDLKKFEGSDVLFGGPPCQGFSVAGKMDPDDGRSKLVGTFIDAVEVVRPRAFVMENVKALATLRKWGVVREELLQRARGLGYTCHIFVLNAANFGVPQQRERFFLFGFADPIPYSTLDGLLRKRHKPPKSVREVLIELGPAGSEKNDVTCLAKVTFAAKPILRRSPYAGMLFNGQGRPLDPARVGSTLPATMGGNRTPIIDELQVYSNEDSWVEQYHNLLMSGAQPHVGQEVPSRLRRLTVNEALRLQTFPVGYKMMGPKSAIYRQIGNAVPCDLALAVAESIRDVLEMGDALEPATDGHLTVVQSRDQSALKPLINCRRQSEFVFPTTAMQVD